MEIAKMEAKKLEDKIKLLNEKINSLDDIDTDLFTDEEKKELGMSFDIDDVEGAMILNLYLTEKMRLVSEYFGIPPDVFKEIKPQISMTMKKF